ncbi:serine/arginine repetitive matrix protein 3-like [Alexandromys fortis]|uniref:serine/arginine repetitive matrix protein 3-like n=1 Tax=Alexandromys fortis TaxID=100897 RepID=UPI002152BC1F|nr:serine/arginine repetitive matrix protein 3-like [Microtus fortis]
MGLQGNAQPGAPKESRGPRRPSTRGGGRHLPSEAVPRGTGSRPRRGAGGGRTRCRERAPAVCGARPPRHGPCSPGAGGARTCPAPRGSSAAGRLHPPGASRASPRHRPPARSSAPAPGKTLPCRRRRRRRHRRVSRQVGRSEPVAQPVTAAVLRRRRLSPTTTWRPRPPQEAGGRGGERRAGSDGPPACLPGRPWGTDSPPRGSATLRDVPAHLGNRGALDREGVGRSASLPAMSRSLRADSLSRSCHDPPGSSSTRTLNVYQECQRLKKSVLQIHPEFSASFVLRYS